MTTAPEPTPADMWHATREQPDIPAKPFRADPRYRPNGDDTVCQLTATQPTLITCTRGRHEGRHIAAGDARIVAAWPGTHAPTLDDLGPTPDTQQPAEQPPALVLPAGWQKVAETLRSGPYYRVYVPGVGHLDADRDGVTPTPDPDADDEITDMDIVREHARALDEAAGIVDQLLAGAW